jgi:SAM-dependent methyltransferase
VRISETYTGTAGEHYFSWQEEIGDAGAELNLWKFQPYVTRHDTVIDFGCGSGGLLANLTCEGRIGVEPNPAARTLAARRGITVVSSASDLDDATADVAISNHALEHTLEPFRELRHLRRALKPGGTFVLVVPSERGPRSWRPGDVNHHLFTWTPLLLGDLLVEAGFEVERCRMVYRAWPPGYTTLRRWPVVLRALGGVWAVVRDERQIHAVARVPA